MKNSLVGILSIALITGAFGVGFGISTMMIQGTPIPLPIAGPQGPQGEPGSIANATGITYYEEMVLQDIPFADYKTTKNFSIANKTRLDWVWIMSNSSIVSGGGTLYLNISLAGMNFTLTQILSMQKDVWINKYWTDYFLPNGTDHVFNLAVYNNFDGVTIDAIILFQYTVF